MKLLKNSKTTYFKSIDFLPIYNYFKVADGNFRYLIKGIDYEEECNVSVDVFDIWQSIEEQFAKAMDDVSVKEFRIEYFEILRLKHKISVITNCIYLLMQKHDDEIASILKGYKLRYNKDNRSETLRQIQGELKNYERKVATYYADKKEKKQEIEQEKESLYDYISKIESYKQISINPHKLTTAHFIAYIKEIKNGR